MSRNNSSATGYQFLGCWFRFRKYLGYKGCRYFDTAILGSSVSFIVSPLLKSLIASFSDAIKKEDLPSAYAISLIGGIASLGVLFASDTFSHCLKQSKQIKTQDELAKEIKQYKSAVDFSVITPDFLCPISKDVMQYPIKSSDGHYYDKPSLCEWYKKHDHVSPLNPKHLILDPTMQTVDQSFQLKILAALKKAPDNRSSYGISKLQY